VSTSTTQDGTQIYFKNWSNPDSLCYSATAGPSVRIAGRPDAVSGIQRLLLHCHDRRGHGRWSQPWNGNMIDT